MTAFSTELELSGQFVLVWRRLKWWLLVAAAAGALALVWLMQHKTSLASAQGHFSLSEARVQLLASDYQQLAPQSQLFIGALEVDELARLVLLLDSDQVWLTLLQSKAWCSGAAALCANSTEQARQLLAPVKARFQFEQKRRGNLLFVRWRDEDPQQARQQIRLLLDELIAQDQAARSLQLQQQAVLLQQALDKAASVGERSVLAQQLDKNNAELNLWQQGYYQPLKAVAELSVTPAKPAPLWFAALLGAVLGVLALLVAGLLLLRR